MTAQEFIDREARYGAHNYHPLPVVLERGEGDLCLGYRWKKVFRFSFCLFGCEPGTLSSEDCEGNDRSGSETGIDFAGFL